MGFNIGGGRSSQKNNLFESFGQDSNTSARGARTGGSSAVFDSPQAQQILSFLTGASTDENGGGIGALGNEAAGAYRGLANTSPGGNNPHLEALINASNQEGDQVLANNLAKVRAGGFRGGTGANMYNQATTIGNEATRRTIANEGLRFQAGESDANRVLQSRTAGAAGLAGLSGQNQAGMQQRNNLGAQILALLRGENFNENNENNVLASLKGQKQGVSTTAGSQFGGSFGGGR